MTTLHSFIDIFDSSDNNAIQLKKIVIPIIQRDYAQGRIDSEVDRIRKRFLDALYYAVTEQPVTLDFVYGDIDKNGVMTPLDGQQRLTTLFLLHWYAAKKDHVEESEYRFLKLFSYATRYSARNFCEKLVDFTPSFEGVLSEEIIDQPWFPLDWKKDPTISAMLVMLNAIDRKFQDIPDLWKRLKEDKPITFYFLPIKDMGLTDELYIKMNSRGKPLTRFEHFKAELEKEMKVVDEKAAGDIIAKFDRQWLDLFWGYRNGGTGTSDDDTTDDEFLNYFTFICDVICYMRGESAQSQSHDEFDLIRKYFSNDSDQVLENMEILEKSFDCWCDLPEGKSPAEFLKSFMSAEHESGKIRVDRRYRERIDIFEDCLHSYGRQRSFPLHRFVILFAINCYLQHKDTIDDAEFKRRIRIVNNLVQNSEDEIADRSERNRMPSIIEETEYIMLTGGFDDSIENHFNVNQIQEEKEKLVFLDENPGKAEQVFRLEDHDRLHGQIGIVGTPNIDYGDRFISLFDSCRLDMIDRALMSLGDYGQRERVGWRCQYGSSGRAIAWDELFHRSSNTGFEENTRKVLIDLLLKYESFDDEKLDRIINEFMSECENNNRYPWRYYYVKYPAFRPGSFGKMGRGKPNEPYAITIMQTRSYISENSYSPYLKEADPDGRHLDKESYGARLVFGDQYIISQNSAFIVRDRLTGKDLETIDIHQDESGVDTEDRILKLKAYIDQVLSA